MTLYRELQIALVVAVQVKVIQQLVLFELNKLIGVHGVPYLLRHLRNLKVVCLLDEVRILTRMHTVVRHRQRTLDNRILGILPLLGIVAHQKGAVGVQVHAAYLQFLEFDHLEKQFNLEDDVLNVGLGILCLIKLLLAVPVIQHHLQLLLIHSKRVGFPYHVFVVQIKELLAGKVSKFNMDHGVRSRAIIRRLSLPHPLPKLRLFL